MKCPNFKTAATILFAFALTLLSCKKEPGETLPTDPVQVSLTSNQVSLIESENSFALDIFRKVVESCCQKAFH
jgi:hypothetical protein